MTAEDAPLLRFRMFTPSGFIVPGMSNANESELWDRYGRIMGKTKDELQSAGYRAVLMGRGKVVAKSEGGPHA